MVAVPPPRRGPRAAAASLAADPSPLGWRRWSWRRWLAAGACLAIGHGITQRLIRSFGGETAPGRHQSFAVQAFPGQSLEALRQRQGSRSGPLPADLEAILEERKQKKEQAEVEQRRAELEEQQRSEDRQDRLDALREQESPPESERPIALPADPLPTPAVPALPPVPEPAPGGNGGAAGLPPLPEAPPPAPARLP